VELTKLVLESVSPFHWIFEVVSKFVPVTTRVNPGPPAVAAEGLMLVMVGSSAHMAVTLRRSHKAKGPAYLSRNPGYLIFHPFAFKDIIAKTLRLRELPLGGNTSISGLFLDRSSESVPADP
jgi:hypothetical protein